MCKIQFAVITVLAVLVASEARIARSVLPAGKCNTFNIEPIAMDYDKLVKLGKWRVLYVTDAEEFRRVDNMYMEMTSNDDKTFKVDVIKIMDDNSKSKQSYTQTVIDNVIIEDTIDDNGKFKHFHSYPLAMSKEKALLFYRCSDAGDIQVDTRYIMIPYEIPLSEEGREELFYADRKQEFRGNLIQLPNKLNQKD